MSIVFGSRLSVGTGLLPANWAGKKVLFFPAQNETNTFMQTFIFGDIGYFSHTSILDNPQLLLDSAFKIKHLCCTFLHLCEGNLPLCTPDLRVYIKGVSVSSVKYRPEPCAKKLKMRDHGEKAKRLSDRPAYKPGDFWDRIHDVEFCQFNINRDLNEEKGKCFSKNRGSTLSLEPQERHKQLPHGTNTA